MRKNRWILRAAVLLLLLSALLSLTVTVAAGVGTDQDPLITLSYLRETFREEILGKVEEKIAGRNDEIVAELSGGDAGGDVADTFIVVTLSQGQVLTGDIGCEVMLRVGTASCVSNASPGLIDQTDGTILNNGEPLVKNHLYMMTIEGRGVKATAATTKVMVRGGYSVV